MVAYWAEGTPGARVFEGATEQKTKALNGLGIKV